MIETSEFDRVYLAAKKAWKIIEPLDIVEREAVFRILETMRGYELARETMDELDAEELSEACNHAGVLANSH
jgi:hypothetical protein